MKRDRIKLVSALSSFLEFDKCPFVAAGIDSFETIGSDQTDHGLMREPRDLAVVLVFRMMRAAAWAWGDATNAIRRRDIEFLYIGNQSAFKRLRLRMSRAMCAVKMSAGHAV